jgi:hypothetical protein
MDGTLRAFANYRHMLCDRCQQRVSGKNAVAVLSLLYANLAK